jgi:uncharacterized glyoxalase superfamily protein PhnB
MQPKPIPEGHHAVTPHLVVKDCGNALEFYKQAFGAVELGRALSPDQAQIVHASIRIGDSIIFLCDEFPQTGALSPQTIGGSPVTLHLYVDSADRWVERAVEAGAAVLMPLEDTFWGDRYAQLQDPFGHRWAVATRIEEVSAEEITLRMKRMFSSATQPKPET